MQAASDFFQPGVEKVLRDQGKWHKVGEPGHMTLIGIDGTGEALDSIRAGYQDAGERRRSVGGS
jgi:hypothetical protein